MEFHPGEINIVPMSGTMLTLVMGVVVAKLQVKGSDTRGDHRMTASEIKHITFQEKLMDYDEDYEQYDYESDEICHKAEEHYSDEYSDLRSIGLNHKQARKVIYDE